MSQLMVCDKCGYTEDLNKTYYNRTDFCVYMEKGETKHVCENCLRRIPRIRMEVKKQ